MNEIQTGYVAEISYVGTILLSDQLEGSIHIIPMHYVGSVVYIPSDMKVKVLNGDLKLHGDGLSKSEISKQCLHASS